MNARQTLITSCLALLLKLTSAEAAGWEKLPPLPEANGGFASGVDNGHVVVAGGTTWKDGQKRWLSAVHLFDPQALKWRPGPGLDSPMAYGVGGESKKGLVAGNAFVFGGGSTGTQGFAYAAWLEGHGHLVLKQGLPPASGAVFAAGGVLDDRLVFVGGTHAADALSGLRKSAFALNSRGEVEPLPDFPGRPFGIAASATAGKSLFIFAGAHWDASSSAVVNGDQAYAFAMPDKTWRRLRDFPYTVRGLTAVALSDDLIYLAGGFKKDEEGFTDEAFLYDIRKDQYRPAQKLPYKAMVSLVVCAEHLYCLGGEDRQRSRTDACFRIPVAELLK